MSQMNSGYYQPQYPQPQMAPPPQFVPQNAPAGPAQNLQQAVAGGQFPYLNRWEGVGQVFSRTFGNGQIDPGFRWMQGQNGKEGHLEITLKLRKSWQGQNPGVKQSKIKLIAYGQLGQNIMSQLRPGLIVRAVGEVSVSNFQKRQGPQAGQWQTSVQVQLRDGRNGEVPIEYLGILPVVEEGRPAMGGYGQQGGYPQNNGGYQQQQQQQQPQNHGGGFQPPQNTGGYQQPQQPQYQPQSQYSQPQPQQGQQGQYQQPQYQQPAYAPPAQQGQQQGMAPQGQMSIPGQPAGTFMPPQAQVPGAPQQGQTPYQPQQPQQGQPQFVPQGGQQPQQGQQNGPPAIADDDIPF